MILLSPRPIIVMRVTALLLTSRTPVQPPGAAPSGGQSGKTAPKKDQRLWIWLSLTLLLLTGIAGCSVPQQASLSLQRYEGTALDGVAPDFRLTDQKGIPIALSDLRGKIVVLAFLDPRCTDVCPLTAQHFRQASAALGEDASRVAFLAVNVNPSANSVKDVADATTRWGIDTLPSWHFLTGNPEELPLIWSAYNVAGGGEKHGKPGEVEHTPGVYIIDPSGVKRWYISMSFDPALPFTEVLVQRVHAILRER